MKSFKELTLAHEIDELISSTLDTENINDLYDALTYAGTDPDAYLVDWAEKLGYTCNELRLWWAEYCWD